MELTTQDSAPIQLSHRRDLSELQNAVQTIKHEIHKIIVGQDDMIDLLMAAILSNGHALIEGVPGVAKTMTARLLARTIDSQYKRIQFTPDLMPSDVIGTSIYNQNSGKFEFRQGPIFSNLVLIDEINRAPAKTQSALFEVMEERQISYDGITYTLPPPFLVFATQNPIEHEGTYRLPEAQLDRFLFLIEVDYPELEDEVSILSNYHNMSNRNDIERVKAVINGEQLLKYQQQVREVFIEPQMIQYIAKIVNNTRNNSSLYLGGSPRASLAILTSSKAFAAMQGRDFVIPEDIRLVCLPVLRHRLMLTPDKIMGGVTIASVIQQIIEKIEVPR